ncbi:MAG: hypothetical protein Fur0025_19510 [Oscillatoriaceae cyanobacterium]
MPPTWAQETMSPGNTQTAPQAASESTQTPDNLRPLATDNNLLSIAAGKRLMEEARQAVAEQNYQRAVEKLQSSREIFNQLSNFHQQLSASFSGINNQIEETHRRLALESAEMRDEATYQLALVHRANNQPELSVPLLIQIIRSQQPTRDLGQKAYQQLFELGFVEAPYTAGTEGAPTSFTGP